MKKHYTKKIAKKIAKKIKKQDNYLGLGGAKLFPTNLSYWNTFFSDEEEAQLIAFKNELQAMIPPVGRYNIANNNICVDMKETLPTYYIPEKSEIEVVNGLTKYPNERNFYYFNTVLCAAFILYGVLANKMENQRDCNYKLLLKGGKAIQVVLRTILLDSEPTSYGRSVLSNLHKSEDIDVLLIPKPSREYNKEEIKTLAINISELIKWFLHSDATNIDFLSPDDKKNKNKNICKLAVMFGSVAYPFSDIDFGVIAEKSVRFFSELHQYRNTIFGLDVLFECQTITNLLDDKITYYGDYSILEDAFVKEGITKLIDECEFFLTKFKKAIISLNNGLQLSLNNTLDKASLLEANINYFLDKLLEYYPFITLDTLKKIFKDVYAIGPDKVTKLVVSKTKQGQKPIVPPEPAKYSKSPQPIDYIDTRGPSMPQAPLMYSQPLMYSMPPLPHDYSGYIQPMSMQQIQQMQWQQTQWQWQQEQERVRQEWERQEWERQEWERQQQMYQSKKSRRPTRKKSSKSQHS